MQVFEEKARVYLIRQLQLPLSLSRIECGRSVLQVRNNFIFSSSKLLLLHTSVAISLIRGTFRVICLMAIKNSEASKLCLIFECILRAFEVLYCNAHCA